MKEGGFYVVNTAPKPWAGWIYVKTSAFREPVDFLVDSSGIERKVERLSGYSQFVPPGNAEEMTSESDNDTVSDNKPDQLARFWVELGGQSHLRLTPASTATSLTQKDFKNVKIACDEQGWPKSIGGISKMPLFTESPGDFVSVEFTKPQGRWQYHGILHANNPEYRDASLKEVRAEPAGTTKVEETDYSSIYTQAMKHPRLKWLTRQLEVYGGTRATLTVRFHRISSELPEWFYIGCSFPSGDTLPTASAGGMPFTPFTDQLPGTCMDYFAVDSWVNYCMPGGDKTQSWTWISRDAPLVSFGGPQALKYLKGAPENVNKVYAMVLDNTWMTNFVCDEHGVFEFKFELVQGLPSDSKELAEHAETYLSTLQLIIHPNLPEDPIFMERLHKP
jgi:hypothetical protein